MNLPLTVNKFHHVRQLSARFRNVLDIAARHAVFQLLVSSIMQICVLREHADIRIINVLIIRKSYPLVTNKFPLPRQLFQLVYDRACYEGKDYIKLWELEQRTRRACARLRSIFVSASPSFSLSFSLLRIFSLSLSYSPPLPLSRTSKVYKMNSRNTSGIYYTGYIRARARARDNAMSANYANGKLNARAEHNSAEDNAVISFSDWQ